MLRILDMFLSQKSILYIRIFRVIKLPVARLYPQYFSLNRYLNVEKKLKKFIWILKN